MSAGKANHLMVLCVVNVCCVFTTASGPCSCCDGAHSEVARRSAGTLEAAAAATE